MFNIVHTIIPALLISVHKTSISPLKRSSQCMGNAKQKVSFQEFLQEIPHINDSHAAKYSGIITTIVLKCHLYVILMPQYNDGKTQVSSFFHNIDSNVNISLVAERSIKYLLTSIQINTYSRGEREREREREREK